MHPLHLTRRAALVGSLALVGCKASGAPSGPPLSPVLRNALVEIETRAGGRLGVAIVDADRRLLAGHRENERFGMCSTFKMPLDGIVLREADNGRIDLAEIIPFTERDFVAHAPVTRARAAEGGMSVRDLAEAAQITSDNTAANLLVTRLGGPSAFTARLREIGDSTTRLDRIEPEMNYVDPEDERDTTTPLAMAQTTLTLVACDALKPDSRALLLDWMRRTETGARRLRAGLPRAWNAGDKTGTGVFRDIANKVNDVAIAFPPGRVPIAIAAYYEAPGGAAEIRAEDEAVLADVGRFAADALRGQ